MFSRERVSEEVAYARRLIVADRVASHLFEGLCTKKDTRRRVESVANGRKDVVAMVVGSCWVRTGEGRVYIESRMLFSASVRLK